MVYKKHKNYNLRLKSTGAKKVLESINKHFNHKIDNKGDKINIHYLILLKIRELSNYLKGKRKTIDFSKPKYKLNRIDTEELKDKISNISYYKWKKAGLSKGTLHYLKKNTVSDKPFSINKNILKEIINL